MRDEVVLRTACGCTKIISAEYMTPVISVAIHVPYQYWRDGEDSHSRSGYERRDFRQNHGEQDEKGRFIYYEVLRPRLDSELEIAKMQTRLWQKRYEEAVYGMDKGL